MTFPRSLGLVVELGVAKLLDHLASQSTASKIKEGSLMAIPFQDAGTWDTWGRSMGVGR
jgi:hypothetical protein